MIVRASVVRIAASCVCAAMLAACSGGNAVSPIPPKRAIANVAFTMHWPSRTSLSTMRRPMFISPSAMSLVVEVSGVSAPVIANNPSTTGTPATSTVNIPAPSGSDTFFFTLYDQTNGTGQLLGQAQVTKTIVAGAVNTVSATVDGVLAKIGVTAAPNQPFLEVGKDAGGSATFTMVGDQPATFSITPLDADGNVIVAPGVVPSISLSSPSSEISVAQSSTNPSVYTVALAQSPTPGSHPSLVASGTDGNNFSATTSYPLTLSPAFFVTREKSTSAAGGVSVVDATGTAITAPGGFPGLTNPQGIAFDPTDHVLFVADPTANSVLAFNENGDASTAIAAMPVPGADAVAYDKSSGLVYASGSGAALSVFTATTGAPVTVTGFGGLSAPNGVAIWNNDIICVTSATVGTAPTCFTNTGAVSTTKIEQNNYSGSNLYHDSGIAFDPAANLIWVAAQDGTNGYLTGYSQYGYRQAWDTTTILDPRGLAYNPVTGDALVVDHGHSTIEAFSDVYPFAQDNAATITLAIPTAPTGLALIP